jgi:hypothetical protein
LRTDFFAAFFFAAFFFVAMTLSRLVHLGINLLPGKFPEQRFLIKNMLFPQDMP